MLRTLAIALLLASPAVAQAEPAIDFRLVDGGADVVNGVYSRLKGTTSTLSWYTTGCMAAAVTERSSDDQTPRAVSPNGSMNFTVDKPVMLFDLDCYSRQGKTSKSVLVSTTSVTEFPPAPGTGSSFTGSRRNIFGPLKFGNLSLGWYEDSLSWHFPYASLCTASGNWTGNKGVSGSQKVFRGAASTTYRLTCVNAAGSVVRSVTLE